ncbi:hypothetical protein HPB49_014424 [Dermacentor silvarum]|uniref:Uncharacterized protein n=1 Tax=Dermacentor silvarum TaxID=543639 RepID=A0ACB8D632_DERSI|nr:hypothetical protein HPB49_014424 [Dermacentor silvarum]
MKIATTIQVNPLQHSIHFFKMASEELTVLSGSSKPAPRFTPEEKSLFLSLVNNHKKVLECEKTDVASLSAKTAAWKKLAVDYNAQHGVTPRDFKQLKKCWGNLKQKWKEEISEEKRKIHKTEEHRSPGQMQTDEAMDYNYGVTNNTCAPNADENAAALEHLDNESNKENEVNRPAREARPRPPRGRMALLERALSSENGVRIALLREEHKT